MSTPGLVTRTINTVIKTVADETERIALTGLIKGQEVIEGDNNIYKFIGLSGTETEPASWLNITASGLVGGWELVHDHLVFGNHGEAYAGDDTSVHVPIGSDFVTITSTAKTIRNTAGLYSIANKMDFTALASATPSKDSFRIEMNLIVDSDAFADNIGDKYDDSDMHFKLLTSVDGVSDNITADSGIEGGEGLARLIQGEGVTVIDVLNPLDPDAPTVAKSKCTIIDPTIDYRATSEANILVRLDTPTLVASVIYSGADTAVNTEMSSSAGGGGGTFLPMTSLGDVDASNVTTAYTPAMTIATISPVAYYNLRVYRSTTL